MEIREVRKVSFAVVVTDIGTFRVWDSGAVGKLVNNEWTNLCEDEVGTNTFNQIREASKVI